MRYYTFIITLITLLFSCTKEDVEQTPNPQLVKSLDIADEFRYRSPMIMDSILLESIHLLDSADDNELWAKYYYLKAHSKADNEDYEGAVSLLDSATNTSFAFATAYQNEMNLLYGLIYEGILLYKDALTYVQPLCTKDLRDNDKLIGLLLNCRLHFCIREDYKYYFNKVDSLIINSNNVDRGLYYAHKAALFPKENKNYKFDRLALKHHRLDQDIKAELSTLNSLTVSFINYNLDSAQYYMNQARELIEKNLTVMNTCIETGIHMLNKARVDYKRTNYLQSLEANKSAIALFKRLKREYQLYVAYTLQADIHFALEQYKAALKAKDLALKHRLEYSSKITSHQIRVNNAKERVEKLKQENKYYAVVYKNERMSKQIAILFITIAFLVIILLYLNRKKLRENLNHSFAKLHKKDVAILSYQGKLESIKSTAELPYHDKAKVSKIKLAFDEKSEVDTWEVFNEMYNNRYPQGEIAIRKAFPQLNEKDYKHIMCIHYGFSNQKIATLFDIQKDSVRRRSNRIKQTIMVPKEIDLKDIVLEALK